MVAPWDALRGRRSCAVAARHARHVRHVRHVKRQVRLSPEVKAELVSVAAREPVTRLFGLRGAHVAAAAAPAASADARPQEGCEAALLAGSSQPPRTLAASHTIALPVLGWPTVAQAERARCRPLRVKESGPEGAAHLRPRLSEGLRLRVSVRLRVDK